MSNNLNNKNLARNISLSLIAQLVSFLVSIITSFILPKYISEYSYSYYQAFLLYSFYVPVLLLGLVDGILVKYSKYEYEDLNKKVFRSTFKGVLILESSFCFIGIIIGFFISSSSITKEMLILVSFSTLILNLNSYFNVLFQITNRIKQYAFSIVIQKIGNVIFFILLLLLKVDDFKWYAITFLVSYFPSYVYGIIYNKDLFIGESLSFDKAIEELKSNIKIGFELMLAGLSAPYIIGGAKLVIQWHFGALIFGKVSLAFSVTNLFINFISAASIALFPSLSRLDENQLPNLYIKMRNILAPFCMVSLMFYFPGYKLLEFWLPQYSLSLDCIGILLPIILFSTIVNLLTNNYLKLYRKEKEMFLINVGSMLLSFILYLVGAYIFDSLYFVLYLVLIMSALRSFISEFYLSKIICKNIYKDLLMEGIMSITFVVVVSFSKLKEAFICYLVLLIIYLFNKRNNLKKE